MPFKFNLQRYNEDVLTLGSHVYDNFYAAPVDWLVDDYGWGGTQRRDPLSHSLSLLPFTTYE